TGPRRAVRHAQPGARAVHRRQESGQAASGADRARRRARLVDSMADRLHSAQPFLDRTCPDRCPRTGQDVRCWCDEAVEEGARVPGIARARPAAAPWRSAHGGLAGQDYPRPATLIRRPPSMPRLPLLLAAALLPLTATAVDVQDTRMVDEPAAHGTLLAFTYDNDLWLAPRNGGPARRLTQAPGRERFPRFSPDGRWLAFSANYGGNVDVYVMPASGGEPRGLTWPPGRDLVRGFTPDGSAVLYESEEGTVTRRSGFLYTVPVAGGVPTRLPVPSGSKAALSPDGRTLAYTPQREAFGQWKNYRGGRQSRIWLLDLGDLSVREVLKADGGSNETDPMWIGGTLYFNSDRNGEFNLFRYDAASGHAVQLTRFEDFPVRAPSADDAGGIVF